MESTSTIRPSPSGPARLQQVKGAYNISVNEVPGTADRTVYVRLSSQMYYMCDTVLPNHPMHLCFLAQVNLLEKVLCVFLKTSQVCSVTRVCETV